MKRTAAIILSVILIFSAPFSGAGKRAEARSYNYARIVSDDAAFYSDAALIIERFTLPKSYFLKIVSVGVESSRVKYMDSGSLPAAEGYVKNADLYFTEEEPISPYPELALTVAVDEVMFSDVTKSQPKCVLQRSCVAYYYGETEYGGETYLYVYSLGNVGYVKKSSFADFYLPYHPSFVEEIAPVVADSSGDDSSSTPIKADGGVTSAQIIIIALLIVGVLCMLFLLLRPEQKSRKRSDYYDDD